MPRFAYVNGRYLPHGHAMVHIEDRGFQFADSVYEVVTAMDGALIDEAAHLARLAHSLRELKIAPPMGVAAMRLVMRTLMRRNGLVGGTIYIQVTRGVAPRDFKFPERAKSSLVMTTRRAAAPSTVSDGGVAVVTVSDIRWARRDIKSTGLLAQVLAKQTAAEAGAYEAWMVDPDGFVTEGASSNAWIVTTAGVLVSRPTDHSILKGVTGNSVAGLARMLGIGVERRPFTVAEALAAREAFITSANNFCVPVVAIDGRPVGKGAPGDITAGLRRLYLDYARGKQAEIPWTA